MNRVRLPIGRSLFFLGALLFALLALLPLRSALSWLDLGSAGLSARAVRGSVWLGSLEQARIGSIPLGDVQARLNTLPLLLGRARVTLARPDDRDPFEGALTVSRNGFGFDDVTGRLSAPASFAPLPIAALELEDFTAGFDRGRCARAGGRVRAAVAPRFAAFGLPAAFDGGARCAEGALLLSLASQSGMERLDLRLLADGRYRAELLVRSTDQSLRPRLIAAGFRPSPTGWRLRFDGSF